MNGPQNGLSSRREEMNIAATISQPLTLQQALPYSPQTSTVPFIPYIIPDPSIGSGSPAEPVSGLFPRQEFDNLNEAAAGTDQQSKNIKQAVDFVLHDMKPAQRTQYDFRPVPHGRVKSTRKKPVANGLTPVTQAVHDRVETYFKASKSVKADKAVNGSTPSHNRKLSNDLDKVPKKTPDKVGKSTLEKSSPIASKNAATHNAEAAQSSSMKVEIDLTASRNFDPSGYEDFDSFVQPVNTNPASSKKTSSAPPAEADEITVASPEPAGGLRIEFPTMSGREEYADIMVAPDAPSNLSARRYGNGQEGQDLIGSSLDQRQRGEAALDALESQLRTIFSAVGHAFAMEPGYDHIVRLMPDQEVAMTAGVHQKLHGALQKAIDLRTFDRVALENLLQIIKLSETSLKYMDIIDIHIDEKWDEAAVDSWVAQLADVETAMKAARTCLRILSGGREDKQLYAEAMILRCVNLCKSVTEDIVMPLVELGSSGTGAAIFKLMFKHKKTLSTVFVTCQKLFALMGELIARIELSETAINTLEYTASKLIFVENAHVERESVVGVQKFDGIRSVAMDILCQIFVNKPEQRQGIIDDILTSLEKLPVGKQSSKQFKLADGGSIQPVSALIMRLVQSSSGKVDQSSEGRRAALLRDLDGDADSTPTDTAEPISRQGQAVSSLTSEEHASQQHAIAIQELDTLSSPLYDTASRNASYVINFIVKRAIGSTKSGDTPYRNLLDLFVDDFTVCLDSPDWPCAELLLRLLMLRMVQLFEGQRTAVPAKNMALELLGSMSAAISRLRSHVKRTATNFEGADADEMARYLADLAIHVLEQKSQPEYLVAWAGPFRAVLEYLQSRSTEDQHLASAVAFVITDWANRTYIAYDSIKDEEIERDSELGRLAYRLRKMVADRKWLASEYRFKAISANQAKLAFAIILLRSPLCESFGKILNILLGSMASDQATVRSKSLKSINQVLETDPSILDGDSSVIQLILECSSDSSTQVRDSALGLLGSCITMRSALESSLTPKIIDRFQDAGVGVRKRAMKLARDIYLRNRNKGLRCAIANGLLRRVQDPDEGVRDLARQMIEEVWFAPFYSNDGTAAYQTAITEHVALIIQTVKTGTATEVLDKVFHAILRPNNKSLEGPFSVCSKLVSDMFGLLDNPDSEDSSGASGRDALQVLTIFANADPKLFNFEQIRLLKPQLASFAGQEELAAFRAVTVIYKRVLPQLSTVHSQFLGEVRKQLLQGVGKISSRGALDDLIACAKVVCDLLNDFSPMANLVASSLVGIQKIAAAPLDPKRLNILCAYAIIVGNVAKHCDLDQQIEIFKAKFQKWQGDSVPRLIVDIVSPFTNPKQPLEARKAALEAIGLVCQSWPRNYVLAKVYTAFQQVFLDQIPILENMILRSFKEFLMGEERRSEASSQAAAAGGKRELTIMGGTNFDDVASATTQRFIKDFTRIALSSQDEFAFLAMEVLGSINRQGLTHPKETGLTLITLETSANKKIAELAFSEHRSLHEKHETVLEREYTKAVQLVFNYQRDIVKDIHGATTDPFQAKLHLLMEVLKISKMKNKQRFMEKLCYLVNFDLNKLDAKSGIPQHVAFARFVVDNLVFFEYQTMGEVHTVVKSLEKIVSTTGATVAQAIESEIFNMRMDMDAPNGTEEASGDAEGEPAEIAEAPVVGADVEPARSRQLASASVILLMLWEARTYLRKLYNMGTGRHDSKAKLLTKDLNKSPTKVQGVHGDKIWEELAAQETGYDTLQGMVNKCKALIELMSVDKEFKVVEDDEQADMDGAGSASEGGEDDGEGGDRGRKRKGGSTPGGRKKRPRSDSQPRKRGRPRLSSIEADDDEGDGSWL
ncbi:Armadillo-type fold protein [Cordyceps fumosorosea ARSEF 2679]|uniref:Sister chromatid cohesion protein n=1 Tax=Cordyceps fumosorosea (strain ARSEF 2679) TaxID=1081104 RepID=A0A167V7I7_CORFA|nr:Armadillo-type fold protein [Cordyceps fumosorosea ARSEF 2679]OAA62309.1 Armadillo-type fold protein [Cordyceps fumosorosea ARSEF 2679]